MPLFTVKLHRRRQQSCGRVDVRGRAPDGCGAGGNGPQPCFQSSICALAFSPDGSLLLAGGTSGGDEHTLCAFEWSTGTLVAKTVAIVARPLGLFRLVVGQLASKAEDDKARRSIEEMHKNYYALQASTAAGVAAVQKVNVGATKPISKSYLCFTATGVFRP